MARRRGSVDETDPMDLLLDTVSNVFGGVMFLTLLAALMVISRSASDTAKSAAESPSSAESDLDARLVELETRQVEQALQVQNRVLANLDVAPEDIQSVTQIEQVDRQIAALRTRKQSLENELSSIDGMLISNQKAEQTLQEELAKLDAELEEETELLQAKKRSGQRSIEFRPLRASNSDEAVVVLRYGRVYLFRNSPQSADYNRDDFFVIDEVGKKLSITPKPHRGIVAQPDALSGLVSRLRSSFPASSYKITIAVYDDSFGQFNLLIDALTDGGYNYRTITCTAQSELSFSPSGPTFVQ